MSAIQTAQCGFLRIWGAFLGGATRAMMEYRPDSTTAGGTLFEIRGRTMNLPDPLGETGQ